MATLITYHHQKLVVVCTFAIFLLFQNLYAARTQLVNGHHSGTVGRGIGIGIARPVLEAGGSKFWGPLGMLPPPRPPPGGLRDIIAVGGHNTFKGLGGGLNRLPPPSSQGPVIGVVGGNDYKGLGGAMGRVPPPRPRAGGSHGSHHTGHGRLP